MTDIKDRVAEELNRLNLSYAAIGRKFGVHPQTPGYWMNGTMVPKAQTLAKFHEAGLDIFYIITGKRIGDIVNKTCCNCRHYHDCDAYDCDEDCDTCGQNACRNCANQSNWLWEGYHHAKT